ncbi:MAG: sulfatase-like hydrolase/transferase [Myxococcota bacterium]
MRTRTTLLLGALAAFALGCHPAAPEPPDRTLLVLVDTLRRDHLPMFGGDTDTPHMAALAARGSVHALTASFHQTTMSMGALFTGRTPSLETGDPAKPLDWKPAASCGMARFAERHVPGRCLPDTVATLGEVMRASGRTTVGVVANALLFDPAGFSRGFDVWREVGVVGKKKAKRAARQRTWRQVNDALRAVLPDLPRDAPLFLYVHYLDVHDWLYRDMSYAEAVEEMDRGIGDLLESLDAAGLLEGMRIVLASDHGEMLGGESHVTEATPLHLGNPSFRGVLDVPLVLVGVDASRLPAFPRSEDLFHLLRGLADGSSDAPATRDLRADEVFLTELAYQTYQRGRFKSLRRRDGPLLLLDLEEDPGETRDVAAAHPEVVEAHRRRVETLTRELSARESAAGPRQESEVWLDRLRALGYVE